MSFITKDRNLINKLLKLAQQNPNNPDSPQDNFDVAADPISNLNVIENLIKNLEQNIDQQGSSFSSDRDNTNLFVKDLENSYSFLHFLARNVVRETNTGYPLSIGHRKDQLAQEVEWFKNNKINQNLYFKYPQTSQQDSDDFQFWVNKSAIIDFIRSLDKRSSDKNQGGDLMAVMLGKIKNEISQLSGQNINPDGEDNSEDKGDETDLPDNYIVDAIPNPVDLNDWGAKGTIPLTVGDLRNDGKLKSWVGSKEINLLENNKQIEAADRANICKLLNVLYKRADKLNTFYAADENQKVVYSYYLKQMTSFVKTNNCPVDTSGRDKSKEKSDKDGDDSTNKKRKPGSGGGAVNIDEILKYLPLRTDVVNFERILRFFNFVENNIAEEDVKGEFRTRIENLGSSVSSEMNEIKNMVKTGQDQLASNFSLNSHPNDIVNMLKEFRRYNEFLQKYMNIVNYTQNAVSSLMQGLEDKNISDATMYYLKAQVGYGGSEASSIAYQNKAAIRQLSSSVGQAIKSIKSNPGTFQQ